MFKQSIRPLVSTRLTFVRYNSSAAYTAAVSLLKGDLKKAMIAKDEMKKTAIRSMLSAIKNKEIDLKGKSADEYSLYDMYSKLISQRKDSINEFIANKRDDLVDKERGEMDIIKKYMDQLPVSSELDIDQNVKSLLDALKEKAGDKKVQIKEIMGQFDLKSLPTEWKTSPTAIKNSIVKQFKEIFK
ncbi:Aim41p SKDI_15G3580 [Saccharomyces kudriavzevii IFO 1802]|uniref:Altered inheritance of mitochondria protein 41 n=2 Tax=Saccharomyces kudriavzevii (strain ATCC MYA-4449 / AS 2.2408 / CBS 8840 / NBRC 1802 / NCYC 2889) TaxID=226230 RepID=J6EEP8_SACK1|nr:uncharacterized protein SKDI_15G3580 [Saccharomyces kudriavzevii IFO 1802]EJT42624.1 AIM41-like protein [Saccharomyces kudriavzevii IFO 1802]CAI4051930.1 hypothetical protein SKDI_15G3580 [Saccharomyces kudriavzevii IFO 1802]